MIAAAFETSSRPASVALGVDGVCTQKTLESEHAHASDLLPALDELMQEAGCETRRVDAVFVGTGPGSYTGLRVGIATAMGLARGSNARILGVPSGETLAYSTLKESEEGTFLIDARQAELYFAHYVRTVDEVDVIHAPCVIAASELAERMSPTALILGDENAARAANLDDETRARMRSDVRPAASALLELGLKRLETAAIQELDAIEPLYLRPFAAKPRRR